MARYNPYGTTHANLISPDKKCPLFSLKCLDPGSGRKIPATWHCTGANPGVFIPETLLVLRMATFVSRGALRCAWRVCDAVSTDDEALRINFTFKAGGLGRG